MTRFKYGLIAVWPCCWLSIYDNFIGILTLGYHVPNTCMAYACWINIKIINWKNKNG